MRRGPGLESSVANEFPATSARTESATELASVRRTRPGAASNDEGPGVSNSRFRKLSDSGVIGGPTQLELEKYRPLDRVSAVGCDLPESEPPVQRQGSRHR